MQVCGKGRKRKKMTDCKACPIAIINIYGDIGCPKLKDWLTREEYKEKKILDNCPENKEQK